jgi:opacity protein-like surface antigen
LLQDLSFLRLFLLRRRDKYSAFIPLFNEQLEASETRTGWTVGGGIEWAFWSNWSAKAEYDYYDFGTRTITLTVP